MISIDYTLLIQIANFLVLLLILNIILYRPIRNILSRRKEEIHAFETTIRDFQDRFSEDAKKSAKRPLTGIDFCAILTVCRWRKQRR